MVILDVLSYLWHHLVSHVHLGEAESLEVGARGPDRRSDGFHQQLLKVLANKGPHLLQHLGKPSRHSHNLEILYTALYIPTV